MAEFLVTSNKKALPQETLANLSFCLPEDSQTVNRLPETMRHTKDELFMQNKGAGSGDSKKAGPSHLSGHVSHGRDE